MYEYIKPNEKKEFIFSEHTCIFNELDFLVNRIDNVNLSVKISNKETEELCFSGNVTDELIRCDDKARNYAFLSMGKVLEKSNYIVTIENMTDEEIGINIKEDQNLNVVTILHSNLSLKIASLIIILFIVYLIVVNKFVDFTKIELHTCFLIISIPIALLYFIFFAPWNVPDSKVHYGAIYRFSNLILGYTGDDEWNVRETDWKMLKFIWEDFSNPEMQDMAKVLYNFEIFSDENEVVKMPYTTNHMNYYSFVNYWPQIIGVVLGRLINLSGLFTVYLARFFILMFYIWGCFNAIKKIPVGKSIIMLVSLLPTSLMLSSGMTYDSMVIITTLNLIASILVLYKKEGNKKQLIEAMIWAAMVGAVKGGGYLLILPFAFILIDSFKNKKAVKNLVCILCAGLLSVLLFDVLLQLDNHLYQFGEEGNGKMSASFVLEAPFEYMNMCITTYLVCFERFFTSMIGGELGLKTIILILFISPIIVLSMFEKDEIELKEKDKWIGIFVILLSIILTPMMLLSWTTIGDKLIAGIQGRYFLPVLPIALILLTRFLFRDIKVDEEKYLECKAKCLKCFGILSFVCIYFLAEIYLVR